MTNKIYGNKFILDTVKAMLSSGRLSHSFLIYGEKGLGKKTIAKHIAQMLLCGASDTKPCGICRECRLIEKNAHPDVIMPEQSGKLKTYSAQTCRKVCTDSHTLPSDGERKVYIFSDCDNIQLSAQNALLKIIEEPPEFTYFIFTASSKDVFLSTVLSRIISLGANECTSDECAAALAYRGYNSESIDSAMECFSGNIGMCIEYLENEELQKLAALTKRTADSIIDRDEYSLLTAMSSAAAKDRHTAKTFLKMLDSVIRDAALLKYNNSLKAIGCSVKGAEKLAARLSVPSALKIHSFINKAALDIDSNVNPVLVMSALCGEIINS